MSVRMIAEVWDRSPHTLGTLLVQLALADFANDEGWSWPSVPTLARKSRMSERHVQRVLERLQANGELETRRSEGPHGCNLYRLLVVGDKLSGGDNFAPGGVKNVTQTVIEPSEVNPPTPHDDGGPSFVAEVLIPDAPDTGDAPPPTPAPRRVRRPQIPLRVKQDALEVMAHYAANIDREADRKNLDPIVRRLRNLHKPDLVQAIDRFAANPWWMERNAIRGVGWFFKSDDQIRYFMRMEPERQNGKVSEVTRVRYEENADGTRSYYDMDSGSFQYLADENGRRIDAV